MKPASLRLFLPLALLLAGCVYEPPLQQGNVFSEEDLQHLEPGMSREQVRYLLGTPLIDSLFTDDRWRYLYYHDHSDKTEKRLLIIHFYNGRVARIEQRFNDSEGEG